MSARHLPRARRHQVEAAAQVLFLLVFLISPGTALWLALGCLLVMLLLLGAVIVLLLVSWTLVFVIRGTRGVFRIGALLLGLPQGLRAASGHELLGRAHADALDVALTRGEAVLVTITHLLPRAERELYLSTVIDAFFDQSRTARSPEEVHRITLRFAVGLINVACRRPVGLPVPHTSPIRSFVTLLIGACVAAGTALSVVANILSLATSRLAWPILVVVIVVLGVVAGIGALMTLIKKGRDGL